MADDKRDQGDNRVELAADRTEFAEDRTVLANERTLAGWFRTGLTAVGVALGFHALFASVARDWMVQAIATIFLAVAAWIFVIATWRTVIVMRRLNTHAIHRQRPLRHIIVGAALTIATVALTVVLWWVA